MKSDLDLSKSDLRGKASQNVISVKEKVKSVNKQVISAS